MLINFKDQKPSQRYQIMSKSIIPRPIAWIVTEAEVLNIAPFSYFCPLSSEPATLIVSIGHRSDGTPKDTLQNLRETQKCVVCIVDDEHFEAMHFSSKSLDTTESEASVFNIEMEKVLDDFPPMPKGIKVAFFAEYLQEIALKGSKNIPIILEIKHLYLDDKIIYDKEKLNLVFSSIARVGRGYATLREDLETPEIP